MLFTRFKTKLFLILLFLPLQLSALLAGTYTAPPFSMYEDGEYIGLATEAIQALLKEAGIKDYKINEYPLARGLVELEAGRIDILYPYLTVLEKNKNKYKLIGPISKYHVALFVRKDYSKSINLAAMHGMLLGAERGSVGYDYLTKHNMQLEATTQELSCLRMVVAQRLNACAMGTLPGMYTAAINSIYPEIRFVQTDFYADLYLALGPNISAEDSNKIQNAYKKLKAANFFEIKQKDYEKKFKVFIDSLA